MFGDAASGFQVGVGGGAGIVNQSGGLVDVRAAPYFAVGGNNSNGDLPGQGTYNLSGGTLNTG